ncbi:hypothetical protein [Mycobacteroides immunogenum]|nr:hypothetical protein [Mycobacteroides immunogenum]AMT72630.1 hypothetical protein ABG82_22550 [Mycobacteroides immunogenum]KPG05956.1 hypothetical protein AN909_19540 [Mycobacteroides immunogenum]KPG08078.1 hypothetical protein AN910_19395 [Mycobacteroides immunogenum]KPG44479.1 hypothetical protein AN915_13420 [Mycobacteroides immunogenum]KPG49345.1 hypothetical protein AN917_18550 [Mycobacteroides immunogenum]
MRRIAGRLAAVTGLLAVYMMAAVAFGAIRADANVGELGPPPGESEIKQTLTDFYNTGRPPDYAIDVQFDGPILVGTPTVHANPPPQPWCVRCGYPDQGTSLMYPVLAIVSVMTTQGLDSSALPPNSFVHTTNTAYNGTPCPGATVAQYCPAYFFYRDGQGNWQIA